MTRILAYAAAFGIFSLALSSPGFAQQSGPPQPATAAPLRIGSGDLIEVTVYDNPDLTGHYRVDDKGDISVPLLGQVHVEGLTAEEAETSIDRRYVEAEILMPANAHATVMISEYATQGITVSGQVKNPGLYPALGVRMLNDVMTAAGGVNQTASSNIILTRKTDPANPITIEYNPEALHPVIPRIQIFPGDSITVPSAGLVYVLGNVLRSGAYVLDGRHTLTVEKAMALAGGSGHGASMNRAHIVRAVEQGRKEDILLDINKIYKGKASDVALKDGDILYIPTSNSKLAAQQALGSIVAVLTAIAIYKVAYQ